jgi:hypothetical protein
MQAMRQKNILTPNGVSLEEIEEVKQWESK